MLKTANNEQETAKFRQMSKKSIEQYRNYFLKNGCDLKKTAEYADIDERTVSRNILKNLKQYKADLVKAGLGTFDNIYDVQESSEKLYEFLLSRKTLALKLELELEKIRQPINEDKDGKILLESIRAVLKQSEKNLEDKFKEELKDLQNNLKKTDVINANSYPITQEIIESRPRSFGVFKKLERLLDLWV